jgi:CBS domain-containing protein
MEQTSGDLMTPAAGQPETDQPETDRPETEHDAGQQDPGTTIPANPVRTGVVRDIMTQAPVGVYYTQTIGETARLMRDTEIGAVLVVNDGTLSGMVTDRDLVVRGLAEGAGPDIPVGPLCSGDLVGVAAEADVIQAEQLMQEHAVRRLPVISDGQVVGIVSIGDIALTIEADSPLAGVSRAQANT